MDVLLIAGSLALSPYLPRYIASPEPRDSGPQQQKQQSPKRRKKAPLAVSVSAGVSFLLLTLSVLEAIPSSWMLLLDSTSLPTAYRVLFAVLVLLVFVVFPFSAGAQQQQVVMEKVRRQQRLSLSSDGDEMKKHRYLGATAAAGNNRWRSYFVRMLIWCFKCIFRIFYCVAYLPARRLLRKESGLLVTTPPNESSLPTTAEPTTKKLPRLRNLVGGMMGILGVFGMYSTLGPWVVRTTEETPMLTVALSWLTAMGILLSACINGFGSVSMPHSCLAGFYLEQIRPEAIATAEEEILKANNSLQERKEQLRTSAGVSIQTGTGTTPATKGRSFADIGEEVSLRRKALQSEIEFLETLVEEMKDELLEMKEMKELAAGARTPLGRLKLWLGVVFSVILLVRLFSATIFLWKHDHGGLSKEAEERKSGSDPITMILLWLIGHHYVTQQDYNTLSQLISVILTAILSFSQVRTFWRAVDLVNRRIQHMCRKAACVPPAPNSPSPSSSSSVAARQSSGIYENFLACLMASYFLSCIVLTKLMLPPDYRVAFADALGDDGTDAMFRIRSYAVNLAFTLSALLTAFVLGILLGIQRQNTVRHLSVWKSSINTPDYNNTLDP